ncbi:hypothetical protein PHLGIDRAFT_408874 [Phlebiopsis gigantea 11061_1 CR5-6]|uniref:Uncharacterized protein n=1 Tax=Phlebiopsis gigantea (strain 11061_1 CR5-6) TaxID=745531 RepID=A0A0C3S8X7_PHLG1|nr:hypothetical protein PHLGIDRAFT_408874 [Phlebiopsis gigantea 11061_1 CR5-6]
MQLKLLPPAPHPTVLFTLAYPAPPPSLPLPLAYAHALRLIVDERLLDADDGSGAAGLGLAGALAPPAGGGSLTPHALDRATWLAAVLSEVVFDLSADGDDAGNVRVDATYVDGRRVHWVLPECAPALRSVLADVAVSAAAADRERREREARHAYHARMLVADGECYPRGASFEVPRKSEREEERRHSLEEFGVGGRASVDGYVETRRGKGRRMRDRVREKEMAAASGGREEREQLEERCGEKGKDAKSKMRHRKKPSLLMSLVAFASSITSRRTPPPSPTAYTPVPPSPFIAAPSHPEPHVVAPQLALPSPEQMMSAADLRRRARATLVDVFRQHVLPALHAPPSARLLPNRQRNISLGRASLAAQCVSCSPSTYRLSLHANDKDDADIDELFGSANEGGYVAWVARSLIQRVDVELRAMRALAGQRSVGRRLGLSPIESLADERPPFNFDDSFGTIHGTGDAEEGETASTVTTESDGSSVHTPSEGTSLDQAMVIVPLPEQASYFAPTRGTEDDSDGPLRRPRLVKQPSLLVPRSPSPPFRPSLSLTPSPPPREDFPVAGYNALRAERARLRSLLTRLAAQHAATRAEEQQMLAMLEARSRRRAWSNRALLGRAEGKYIGLCLPERRSPLSTCRPITASILWALREDLEGPVGVRGKKRGLVVTTAESNIMRLFPVCEEDDEDDEDDIADRTFCADEESSRRWEFKPLARQPTRRSVPVRPRTRTSSISPGASSSYPGAHQPVAVLGTHARAARSTDDLPSAFDPHTKVELFDVYSDEEDGEGAEFTLSMDLPVSGSAHL